MHTRPILVTSLFALTCASGLALGQPGDEGTQPTPPIPRSGITSALGAAPAGAAGDSGASSAAPVTTGTIQVQVLDVQYDPDRRALYDKPFTRYDLYVGGPNATGPAFGGALQHEYVELDDPTLSLATGDYTLQLQRIAYPTRYVSPLFRVTVAPGQSTVVLRIDSKQTVINAHYLTRYGEALYVTGETPLLGEWKTAYKLTPRGDYWALYTGQGTDFPGLPRGLPYKIVRAPWTDADSIEIGPDVEWELGDNRQVETTAYLANDIRPRFLR